MKFIENCINNFLAHGIKIAIYTYVSKRIYRQIELSKYDAQAILLKCTRIARHLDNEELHCWLRSKCKVMLLSLHSTKVL